MSVDDDFIKDAVRRQIEANNDAIETMVERSLVLPGNYGVLVTDLPNGAVHVELTNDVPFQEIHYCRARV